MLDNYNESAGSLLEVIDSIDLNNLSFRESEYFSLDQFAESFKNQKGFLSVFSLNIRGFRSKFEEIQSLIHFLDDSGDKIDVIAFQECRVNPNESHIFQIPGYNLFCSQPTVSGAGGLMTYISDKFECQLNLINNNFNHLFETQFLQLSGGGLTRKVMIANIYTAP